MSITIYEYDRGNYIEKLVRARIRSKSRYWSVTKYGKDEALRLANEWFQKETTLLKLTNNMIRPKRPNVMGLDGLSIINDARWPEVPVARIRYKDASGKLKTTSMSLLKYSVEDVATEYLLIVGCYANTKGQFDCVIPSKHKVVKALNKELKRREKYAI